MNNRGFLVILCSIFTLCIAAPVQAQISRDAKYDILRTVLADTASARMALPFGNDGVDLSDTGQLDKTRMTKDIQKNGQSVEVGKVVTVTDISFSDNKI